MHLIEPLPLWELTREDFEAYERVRRSGQYNMLTDQRDAAEAADLSREVYKSVYLNYEALMKLYPDVRGK